METGYEQVVAPHVPSPDAVACAEQIVADAHANGGRAPLDLERFWADQLIAARDPFNRLVSTVPLGIRMSEECVFDELGVDPDMLRLEKDPAWRLALCKSYNDKAESIVGRRLLHEPPPTPVEGYPEYRKLHDIFEAKHVWASGSWWLEQSAHTEEELAALLDRVEERNGDLARFLLPPEWGRARDRLLPRGIRPPLYRWQRGPVTFATSIYGVENFLLLLMMNPELAARFRDAILRTMLGIMELIDSEAGYTADDSPRGFGFADDNCYLLSPDMYEFFAFPIVDTVFRKRCPEPGDWRFQHSDSAMGHLLPVLSRLRFTGVNFGPTLTVNQIREHMPRTVIHGQLAPFTFSRNQEVGIVAEYLRDLDMARSERGLVFETAGSINNGSRLTGMRLIMAAIQRHSY